MKKMVSLVVLACVLLLCLASCDEWNSGESPTPEEQGQQGAEALSDQEKYALFFSLIEQEEYEAAYTLLDKMGDDPQVQKLKGRFYYVPISSGQHDQPTWTYNQDYLPIQVTSINYKGQLRVWDYTYDSKGNLTKRVLTEGDKISFISEYAYDDNNRAIKYIYTNCAVDLPSVNEYEYEYDASGNVLKQTSTETSRGITQKSTLEYTYDVNGNMLKEVSTDNDGKTYIREWTYDENGNITKYLNTNTEGKTSSNECFYDALNRRTKVIHREPGGGGYDCESFYDDHGNVIKEVTTTTSGNISEEVWQFTYDEKGNIIKKVHVDSASRKTITENTYDESGRLIKEILISMKNETIVTDYTYDAMGREIKKVVNRPSLGINTFENAYDDNGNHIGYCHTAPDGEVEQWFREYKFVYIPYDLSEISEKTREIFSEDLYPSTARSTR